MAAEEVAKAEIYLAQQTIGAYSTALTNSMKIDNPKYHLSQYQVLNTLKLSNLPQKD